MFKIKMNRTQSTISRISRHLAAALTILLVILPFFSYSNSQETDFNNFELSDLENITLYVGQPKTLQVSNPKRIAISRPEIADVESVSPREVMLQPKAPGSTTLFIWDDYGEFSYRLKVFSEELSYTKEHVDSLVKELGLPKITTKINEAEGKILIIGEVADNAERERLLSALGSLKEKVLDLITIREERALVQIDAQILEITHDDLKNLGIAYQTAVTLTDDAGKKLNKLGDMFATSMWTRSKLDITINMLVKDSKARILSQPKVVCLSGKEAEFLVGGQVPIVTTTVSSTGTATNVQFKNYGINLKVRPTVKGDDNIFTTIETEVSEIDKGNAVTAGGISIPAFLTRDATTELYLKDGQSVIIAGLIKNKDNDVVQKFPFLSEVPILGLLWRSRDFQLNQTDLVILLTPTILPTDNKTSQKTISKESFEQKKQNTEISEKNYNSDWGREIYVEDLKRRIMSSLDYPDIARRRGYRGELKVRLHILSNGQLKDAVIISSSKNQLLDALVINKIKELSPFPSFPSSIDSSEIVFDVPIVYS